MENPSLAELLEKYLQYCQVIKNYMPITLKGYQHTYRLFSKETKIIYPHQLNKDTIEGWFFNGRLVRKWGPVTFRHHHKRLNKFLDWLVKEGRIGFNPAAQIEKPRLEHKLPRTVSKDQAQLILDASFHMKYNYTFEKYRNRAIIAIMLLAGLRRREVMNLKLNDVSFETKTIFINLGKGHKDRIIPMNFKLFGILQEYRKDRARLKKTTMYFFIRMQKDEPIGENALKILTSRLRKKTKVSFSAHTLRHGFARLMLEGGCDIYTLSKIMGHSKITTTTIYLSCSNLQISKSIEMHALN